MEEEEEEEDEGDVGSDEEVEEEEDDEVRHTSSFIWCCHSTRLPLSFKSFKCELGDLYLISLGGR